MNQQDYKISVVVPVYNGIKYLEKNISSLLNQTLDNYEVLISDDGSTDGSREILRSFECLGRPNVRFFFQEKNLGLFANLNFLIKNSKAPLIHLWAQDDLMKPECLQEVVNFHLLHRQISMSYHAVEIIDGEDNLLPPKEDGTPELISPNLYAQISIRWGCITGNIANVTLVRSYLDRYGYFDESLRASGDFELFTRLAASHPIGFLSKRLIYLRRHEGQLSRNMSILLAFVKEDTMIYKRVVQHHDESCRSTALVFWKWRCQVLFFNYFMLLVKKRKFRMGLQLLRILQKETSVPVLFSRWAIIRVLNIFKLQEKFYIRLCSSGKRNTKQLSLSDI